MKLKTSYQNKEFNQLIEPIITNEEYHIIEAYRNLSDDLKLAINRILQIDM